MLFWVIVAAVILVGLALAWWTSGRAKPRAGKPIDVFRDANNNGAQAQAYRNRESGSGSGGGGY